MGNIGGYFEKKLIEWKLIKTHGNVEKKFKEMIEEIIIDIWSCFVEKINKLP